MATTKKPKQSATYIVDVIPLSRGIFKDSLSYFTTKSLPIGTLVQVPVRNRKILSLVVSVRDAKESKSALKAASYAIKKIDEVVHTELFLPTFTQACAKTANYFATTTGSVIESLTPKIVLTEAKDLGIKKSPKKKAPLSSLVVSREKFIFQSDDLDRLSTYKSLIREEFAKNSSVFFCLPTISDIDQVLGTLERGINEYTFIFHSGLSKKELIATWKRAVSEPHPVLIVATGLFLSIPRKDLSTLIVDKEHSRAYKTFSRPFIDIRTFAENFADTANLKLIFGDTFLRTETLWRHQQGELIELTAPKFRALSTAKQSLIDMRECKKSSPKGKFPIFSPELIDVIKNNKLANERLVLFISRKGLHSITVCNDCGSTVTCSVCSAPLVLHKSAKSKENVFVCHKCSTLHTSNTRCNTCKSWRLTPLGIGIEKAEEELKSMFPETTLFRIDSDATTTRKKATQVMAKFISTPGSVLLGTEMSMYYLMESIENTAIVSLDSFFTIPDFRMDEKIFNLLLTLRARAEKSFIIQTRNSEQELFTYALSGNLLDFYRSEIKNRKQLSYPPFTTFIKITVAGSKVRVEKEIKKLEKHFSSYQPISYDSFSENTKSKCKKNILLTLKRDDWVNTELLSMLRSLPPEFSVRVDPEDLL